MRGFLVATWATAVAVLIPGLALAQSVTGDRGRPAEVRVLTVQDNYQQPVVRATVETRGERGFWVALGTTDVRGVVRLAHACRPPFRVRVIPESTSFYAENREGSVYECAEAVIVTIRRLRIGMAQEGIPLTELSVVDERQRRVPARIEEIDTLGNVIHIGDVTRAELNLMKETCAEGSQIRVTPTRPEEHIFLRPVRDCAADITFVATRPRVVPWLIEYAEQAEGRGDFGKAALLYNESLERVRTIDFSAKRDLQIRTLTAAGAFFKIPEDKAIAVPDSKDDEMVAMGETLKAAIAAYQKRMNLSERDGTLGYVTLRRMAKADVYPFILKAYRAVDHADTQPAVGGPR